MLVASVDVGGTYTKLGLVNKEGIFASKASFSTPKNNFSSFLDELEGAFTALRAQTPSQSVIGFSVGAPSVDTLLKSVVSPPNLPWPSQTPLAQHIESRFKLPTLLLNDADAAALGEYVYGKAKKCQNFAYLTLGTGLGAAFMVEGRFLHGGFGITPELGHICFRKNGRLCRCSKRGCAETYISATGLADTFEAYRKKAGLPARSTSDVPAILAGARAKDPLAQRACQTTGTWLGEILAHVIHITGSTSVFLAGGIVKSAETFLPHAHKSMEKQLLPSLRGKVRLDVSGLLEENPALLGAAHHFFKIAHKVPASIGYL